ncbi:MAG: YraN family protein [bacterium]|nr:YraN family protein [bacterium]
MARLSPRRSGGEGEDAACLHLRKNGFRILMRNYRGPRYEVDIIAREGEVLSFLEVKSRAAGKTEGGIWAVGPEKQRRIIRAAEHFLLSHPEEREAKCRFDVVIVAVPEGGKPKVETLIRDAFRTAG